MGNLASHNYERLKNKRWNKKNRRRALKVNVFALEHALYELPPKSMV